MIAYLANLSISRQVLWCYLVWYLVMATSYFDPAPNLWLTALGISAIMGVARSSLSRRRARARTAGMPM